MSDYPELQRIGVTRPNQIVKYTLTNAVDLDILRIKYKRPKGSFLPTIKRFEFARKLLPTGETEISATLEAILTELEKLVITEKDSAEMKEDIITEISDLEKFMRIRLQELKAEIEKL